MPAATTSPHSHAAQVVALASATLMKKGAVIRYVCLSKLARQLTNEWRAGVEGSGFGKPRLSNHTFLTEIVI